MRGPAFFISYQPKLWQIARFAQGQAQVKDIQAAGSESSGPTPSQDASGDAANATQADARQVAAALRELGYRGQGACLGLSSEMILSAQVSCSGLPRKQARQAMLYRLEEQLPLAAEGFTADFLAQRADTALGLAVQTDKVKAIVDRLTEAGVNVVSICPTALLALWQHCQGEGNSDYAIIVDGANVDMVRLIDGQPSSWHTTTGDAAELARCLESDALASPVTDRSPTVDIVGQIDAGLIESLRQSTGMAFRVTGLSTLPAAAEAAAGVLDGDGAAWGIDLRRDRLGLASPWARLGGLVRSAVALAILLMLSLVGTFLWMGYRCHEQTLDLERRQAAAYHKAFPNRPAPADVKMILKSELKMLSAIRGAGTEVPDQPSALEMLRQVMSDLPAAVRMRILDLRIDPTGVLIQGQARTHTDAEVVTQALSKGGLVMESPRTENLAKGGVSFNLMGKAVEKCPPKKEAK